MVRLQRQTYVLSLIVIVIFSTNLIFTKQLIPPLSSISYIFMRYLISACVLIGYLIYKGKFHGFVDFLKNNLKEMAYLGLFLNAGALVILFYGLKYTTSTNSFLIQNFSLFIVIILNKILYKKNPSKMRIYSSVFVLVGMIFVMYPLDFSGSQNSLGDLLTLASTLLSALSVIRNKHFCEENNIVFVTTGYSITTVIATLPFVLILGEFKLYLSLTNMQWGAIIYLGIMLSSIGYFMYNKVASDPGISPEMMTLLSVMITIAGVFSGVFFLKENMNFVNIIGAVLVLIAIYLGRDKDSEEIEKEEYQNP